MKYDLSTSATCTAASSGHEAVAEISSSSLEEQSPFLLLSQQHAHPSFSAPELASDSQSSLAINASLSDSDSISMTCPPTQRRAFSSPPDPLHLYPFPSNEPIVAWLEPGKESLSAITLDRSQTTVAIGRGPDAFELLKHKLESAGSNALGPSLEGSNTTTSLRKQQQQPGTATTTEPTPSLFVEVADGRVSRMHCLLTIQPTNRTVILKDLSSNGTFINSHKLHRGGEVTLRDGDRVALVLSVAPLAEVGYIFHSGAPPVPPRDNSSSILGAPRSSGRREGAVSPGPISTPRSPTSPQKQAGYQALRRSATSTYATPEATTLQDLQCQICLDVLTNAVAIEPCGHTFCASCLSHHLAALLNRGQPVLCPLRCAPPVRVIANPAVRDFVALPDPSPIAEAPSEDFSFTATGGVGAVPASTFEHSPDNSDDLLAEKLDNEQKEEEEFRLAMHPLCPLDDACLPMELVGLKTSQIQRCLHALEDGETSTEILSSLETIARLAWSDDCVRTDVREGGGLELIIDCMVEWEYHDGVQCSGCLTLMALVREDSTASSINRWHLALSGGLQAVVAAMKAHAHQPMVQLSALLIMVPLALEDDHMQMMICEQGLLSIMDALKNHADVEEVASKALLALGALAQGDSDVAAVIVDRVMAAGLPKTLQKVLRLHCTSGGEDVLWAALFVLAVISRESSVNFTSRMVALAAAGIKEPLGVALKSYKESTVDQGINPDDMVLSAGEYIEELLKKAEKVLFWKRAHLVYSVTTVALCIWGGLRVSRKIKTHLQTRSSL